MKQYYLSKDQISKEGPFSIKQLETKLIDKETLVWYEGLKEWKKVSEIKELNHVIKKSPFKFEKKSKPKPSLDSKKPLNAKHKMFKNNRGNLKIQSGGETVAVPMNSLKIRNSVSKGGGYGGKNFMIRKP